jgi:choline dehydrogenase-like flavoprotein
MDKKKVIIIGGGTAGLTVAKHLQEYFDVIVIEKSKYKKYPIIYKIPLMIGLVFRNSKTKYISYRKFVLPDGRHTPYYDSNLLGGSSIINGCVHMLGNKSRWKSILKYFNASYEDLLESYGKIFSLNRNLENRINLTSAHQNIIDMAFIETLNKYNIPAGDMNTSDKEACGPILNTAKQYFRSSVLSIIGKKKFKVIIREIVENILFDDNGKVTGVKTNLNSIKADYVIISGGVIGTCGFLLKASQKNKKEGNKFLSDLVIGADIQDHSNLRINVITNKNIGSLNEIYYNFYRKFLLILMHFFGKSTLMTGTGATSAVHLDLDKDGEIDTRIQIVQFTEPGRHDVGKIFPNKPGFSLSITAINPKSKGHIRLEGSDTVVNPMYLSSNNDVELLKLALKYCLKLLHAEPFSDHILEIKDEYTIEHDPEKYIFNNIFGGGHLIGGSHAAINSNFEVHNTDGLYICDASVFNEYAASNIHSSVVLISDIFSKKFVKNNFETNTKLEI